jgi:hypothetical protein
MLFFLASISREDWFLIHDHWWLSSLLSSYVYKVPPIQYKEYTIRHERVRKFKAILMQCKIVET